MKKERYLLMLYLLTVVLFIMTTTTLIFRYNELKEQKTKVEAKYIGLENRLPVPKVVEKEVIVHVEKEVEPEPVEAKAIPEVYLQPINSDFDIMVSSGLSTDDLIRALGNARSGLHDCADAIVEAEQTYGVNALYLAAVLGLESGWGKYEHGNNNIAGWKGGPNGTFSNFNSRYECVMTVARGLSTHFVNSVGSDISDVAIMYCPDYGYLDLLLQIMGELNNNL